MNSFSIMPNSQVDIVDQYTDFLSRELNNELWYVDENDVYNPFLLQQMGVLRASRIQKAVETNGAILYEGLRYTNDTICKSSREVADRMGQVAAGITSSLDRGFTAMHHSLGCINEGIAETNTHLGNIHSSLGTLNENVGQTNQHLKYLTAATMRGLTALHQEQQVTNQHLKNIGKSMDVANHQLQNINQSLRVMGSMIGQGFSLLAERLNATNTFLQNLLDELRIPETQRERRFHIEEGAKYLAMALKENDKFYYEDAIAEFETAIQIERKDFYSWFSLGFIYLRSVHHINIAKAVDAFERFVHYARAEAIQRNNQSLKLKIDEAYLLMAEAKYLLQNPYEAIQLTERCESNKEKALFMKVKYLSFMGDDGSQQRAADILRDMLHQNPFLSLQVLEDVDIIKNKWVVSMLDQMRCEAIAEVSKQYDILLQKVKKANAAYDDELQKIANIINKNTYLDAVEALYLIQNYVTSIRVSFNSNGGDGCMVGMIFKKGISKRLTRNTFIRNGYAFLGWNSRPDGTGRFYTNQQVVTPIANITLYAQWLAYYTDLGLSVKWASCNIGANIPKDNGKLYTFEEAIHNTDGKLPTKEQWEELKNKCTWTWENKNEINGYKVTGPNGNYIFLPAAGYRDCNGGVYYVGASGFYWSSTPDDSDIAWRLRFRSSGVGVGLGNRCYGRSVRLVQ